MTKPRFSMIIQWSPEDEIYVVTLPEWGGTHTHGETYEEAARMGSELLELLIETEASASGDGLPSAHEFSFPGPSGYTYQFSATPLPRLTKSKTRKHAS